jgi:hypothetical protein
MRDSRSTSLDLRAWIPTDDPARRANMAITAEQIEQACDHIDKGVVAFARDQTRLEDLREALSRLQWLREQYRLDKAAVEPYVERLQACAQRVCSTVRAARAALTDEYLRAGQAVSAWRQRREACRDALVELARADNVERFESQAGWIAVRRVRAMSVPKANTAERAELLDIISRAGRWADVGAPNGKKLLNALDERLFPPELAARITQLCNLQTACRLVARASAP